MIRFGEARQIASDMVGGIAAPDAADVVIDDYRTVETDTRWILGAIGFDRIAGLSLSGLERGLAMAAIGPGGGFYLMGRLGGRAGDDVAGMAGRSLDNLGGLGRSADNLGGVGRSSDNLGGLRRSGDSLGGGGRALDPPSASGGRIDAAGGPSGSGSARSVSRSGDLSRKVAYGDPGPGALGSTDKFGNITIRPGLSRRDLVETLRHESVHARLSPPRTAVLANFRADLRMGAYQHSQLLRFAEEATAEGYARRSVLEGLRFPITLGYASRVGLATEIALMGGAGYLAVQALAGE